MSTNDTTKEQPKPKSGHESDELTENELGEVSGGTVINPQPLPPRHMPM